MSAVHPSPARLPVNAASPHRGGITVLVAIAATLVVAGLIAGSGFLERLVVRLPPIPGGERAAMVISALALVGTVIWMLVRLGELGRARARRHALEATVRGEVSCGIRSRLLVSTLAELSADASKPTKLAARYSIVVDELGVSFWNGGRRPRRAVYFPWREVRGIRSDTIVAGAAVVSVLVLRVRRGGTSVELPIIIAAERPGRFALSDAPFFAIVRSWKARHRAALAAEGLEVPPMTAPIPIIRQGAALAPR